jgi:hypothetical protein
MEKVSSRQEVDRQEGKEGWTWSDEASFGSEGREQTGVAAQAEVHGCNRLVEHAGEGRVEVGRSARRRVHAGAEEGEEVEEGQVHLLVGLLLLSIKCLCSRTGSAAE